MLWRRRRLRWVACSSPMLPTGIICLLEIGITDSSLISSCCDQDSGLRPKDSTLVSCHSSKNFPGENEATAWCRTPSLSSPLFTSSPHRKFNQLFRSKRNKKSSCVFGVLTVEILLTRYLFLSWSMGIDPAPSTVASWLRGGGGEGGGGGGGGGPSAATFGPPRPLLYPWCPTMTMANLTITTTVIMQSTVMKMRIMSNSVHLRICSNCLRRGRQRRMTDGQGCFEAVYEGQRGVLRHRLKYKLERIGQTKKQNKSRNNSNYHPLWSFKAMWPCCS